MNDMLCWFAAKEIVEASFPRLQGNRDMGKELTLPLKIAKCRAPFFLNTSTNSCMCSHNLKPNAISIVK